MIVRRVEMILKSEKPEPWPFLVHILVKIGRNTCFLTVFSRHFPQKKTAKIARKVSNLFQNVQKSFRKVRGRDQSRLGTSGGVKMTKSAKNRKTDTPGA